MHLVCGCQEKKKGKFPFIKLDIAKKAQIYKRGDNSFW